MKAIVYEKYGAPLDVLHLKEVEKPAALKDDEVLVKIHAASVNYADVAVVRGKPFLIRFMSPGLFKPKNQIPGIDIAGRVEMVGKNVSKFQPGDEVVGELYECGFGGYAEYVSAPEKALVMKPTSIPFDEAASVIQAAVVALQGIRDRGQIKSGQKVLVNGASGGIGSFAVQLAKHFGAEVTGVCSTTSLDMVRSLGADHVIDYTQEDFTKGDLRYDLIFDIVANRSVLDYKRALSPTGNHVSCAFSPGVLFLGPMISKKGGKNFIQLNHEPNEKDLPFIFELVESGKLKPVIDKRFPLSETAEAIRYYHEGHPRGKIVIIIAHDSEV